MSERGRAAGLGPALLVALLVASLVAAIYVYRARTPDLALEVPEIDRVLGEGPQGENPVQLEFFVRFDEPDARIEIVGRGDATARTLATDAELGDEERIRCLWNGLDDEGDPVAPGNYRLRVVLPGQDRDMVFPLRIAVRRSPPAGDAPGKLGLCERAASGEDLS